MKHLVASKVAAIAKHNIKMKFYKKKIKKKETLFINMIYVLQSITFIAQLK